MAVQLQQNMGTADRVIRGVVGTFLLANGLQHIGNSPLRKVEASVGGAFLAYGITGFDPLLSAFGATTIPGNELNVLNLARHALPGQGIKPSLTENVKPRKPLKSYKNNVPLSEALAIG